MKKITSILFCIFFSQLAFSQIDVALSYANKVDTSKLYSVVHTLASDEYAGRKAGSESEKKSMNYLVDYFTKLNLKKQPSSNSYLQEIAMVKTTNVKKQFEINGKDCSNDYSYRNEYGEKTRIADSSVIFVGYGSDGFAFDEWQGFNLSNKIVMVMRGNPMNKFGVRYANSDNYYTAVKRIKEKKPQAILIIEQDKFDDYYGRTTGAEDVYYDYNYKTERFAPEINITERVANWILQPAGKTVKQMRYEIERDGVPKSIEIKQPVLLTGEREVVKDGSSNVIGYIEGTTLKDECIVVMAHYDHLGKNYNNEVYNGADDNASGVSAVLEIARLFAEAKKAGKAPMRSIVFLLPTAEEMGMYGSAYYVNSPMFPLKKTKGCVNFDMLGRTDDKRYAGQKNYVYVLGRNGEKETIVQNAKIINNNSLKLTVDTEDVGRNYSSSDHYNFSREGVPALLFTAGEHEDYHRTTDDTNKIDFTALKYRTQLGFMVVWGLANQADDVMAKAVETLDVESKWSVGVEEVKAQ